MIRRPPRSTHCISSAASDVYKRQYLYFSSREQADRAGSALRSDGLQVLVRPGATGGWLALAHSQPPASDDAFANLEARMRKLAESLNGEYDGWEAAVSS